jgi:hypothetical protein
VCGVTFRVEVEPKKHRDEHRGHHRAVLDEHQIAHREDREPAEAD